MKFILILTTSLLIPCICFANALTININTNKGENINVTKRVTILKEDGSILNQFTTNENTITINLSQKDYNIVTEYKKTLQDNKVATAKSIKSVSITEKPVTLDLLISKPTLNNVYLVVNNIDDSWNNVKVSLVPVKLSTYELNTDKLDFILNVVNGKAETILNDLPNGKYKVKIGKTDNSETLDFTRVYSISNNSKIEVNAKGLIKPSIDINFKLISLSGNTKPFSGETISYKIKDKNNNTIAEETITGNGEVSKRIDNLNQGQYKLEAEFRKGDQKRNISKDIYLRDKNRTYDINFKDFEDADITFSFVDTKGKPVNAEIKIYDKSNNELIAEGTGTEVTKRLYLGRPYKVSITSGTTYDKHINYIARERERKEIELRSK